MPLNHDLLAKAADVSRGLAIDAVHASQSGHLGLPLGCAEIGAVLFGEALSFCPDHPEWLNRDRFVLSAGHGSMFLYWWLHLTGYPDMTLEEIKNFRQLGSKTPGHPELTHAPSGVETTTGPLGQGVANSVGMAVSAKMAEARFNTPEHAIFDHNIVCLAGDGCMQEGVAMEAVEFAGHQQLDNLILIYDANNVTLDAMAKETQSEDAAGAFRSDRLRRGHGRRQRHGHVPRRVRSREGGRAAASRSSSSPRRSSAKACRRSPGRRRRTAKAGRSSRTPPARVWGCRRSIITSRRRSQSTSAKRKKLDEAYDAWVKKFDAWKAANPALAEELGASARLSTQTAGKDTGKRRPVSTDCSLPSPSSRRTARSRRARPGRTSSSRWRS